MVVEGLGGRALRWASLAFLLATSLLACLPSFPSDSGGDGGGDHDVTPTDGALRSDAPAHVPDGGDAGHDGGTPGLGSDADAASTSDQSVGTEEDADAELAPDQSAGPDGATAVPEAGIDAPVCTNVCTAGATECGTGAVETCTVQANGCTLWEPTTQCGANRLCSVTAGVASCACVGTICSETGETCQGGATVATCAKDANGCLYVASTTTCASPMVCAGTAPDAACALKCSNTCTAGQKSCVSGEIATCTLGSNGCYSYGTAVACPSVNESCSGAAGSASCPCLVDPVCHTVGNTCSSNDTMTTTCAADAQGCIYNSGSKTCTNGACSNGACCTNGCTQGQKSCVSGDIETCALGTNGCWAYGAAVGCPTHEGCTGAAGSGSCTCSASPCTSAADFCVSTSVRANCAQDGPTKCFYESSPTTTTCTNGACSNGACCTNSCTPGQKTCAATEIETCTLGSNGCYSYGPAAACPTHESCTGAAGAGQCTCVGSTCTSAAGVCVAGTSNLANCVEDPATACFYESGTTTCANGCDDGACCPLVCVSGSTQCSTSTSTQSQTCQVASSGCLTWTTQTCPGDYVCERLGSAACLDPGWAEWPMPNGYPDYSNGAPNLEGYDAAVGGAIRDEVTDLVWQQPAPTNLMTQQEAEDYCLTLTLPAGSGTTDWRLPTIIELESLVDTGALPAGEPATIAIPNFDGTAAAQYWSSTAAAGGGAAGWTVDFSFGSGQTVSTASPLNVRCVR